MLYRKSLHGGVYSGTEAQEKMCLIAKIIAGENRWRLRFSPENVVFVDDDEDNFVGHSELGINVRRIRQDGMNTDDVNAVLHFARARSKRRPFIW
mmetsp:Transcript_128972/g.228204  ORF Transcript_128972/g.228204 Transcript_128972/m.228204 type:complete len:95 (-) Transcript_128972:49-333(-)